MFTSSSYICIYCISPTGRQFHQDSSCSQATNLQCNTPYDARVRASCVPAAASSDWTAFTRFSTANVGAMLMVSVEFKLHVWKVFPRFLCYLRLGGYNLGSRRGVLVSFWRWWHSLGPGFLLCKKSHAMTGDAFGCVLHGWKHRLISIRFCRSQELLIARLW